MRRSVTAALTDRHEGPLGGPDHLPDVRERLDDGLGEVVDERLVGVERGHAPPLREGAS